MKLGYSTFAMKMLDPVEAVPRLRSIGYGAVEICALDGWPTAPDEFDTTNRQLLSTALADSGFPPPPVFDSFNVCAVGAERPRAMQRVRDTCEFVCDLNPDGSRCYITTGIGQPQPAWDLNKEKIVESFVEVADIAAQYDTVIAIEAHAGHVIDTPEQVVWVVQQAAHDNLKIDFDISHFVVKGIDVQHCVNLCAPEAVLVHVKDGYMEGGEVRYQLPGEGGLDLTGYMVALRRARVDLPVYAEVSVQRSGKPDYDPWATAKFCFEALDKARRQAGA